MIKIKKNIRLAPYTTYKIGGPAKYFYEAETKEEALEALEYAKLNSLKYFILCGGSNILFSDKGYDGLVIKLCLRGLKLIKNNIVYTEAGVSLSAFISFVLDNNLTGLEFLSGIPGEVGGAIRGNAGAFGGEIENYIKSVEVIRDGRIIDVSYNECGFKYRESIFKYNKDIIISGLFKLEKGNVEKAKEKAKEYINYRKENHPTLPSAGSTFKNIKEKKVAVGRLIEEAGLKGYRVGGAQISEKHANFIVNLGNAKASDVLSLIKLAKERAKEKFNIDLEEEIKIVK